MPTVDAVLVTYHPDPTLLDNVIDSLVTQVRTLYIIDNTPEGTRFSRFSYPNISIIPMHANKGIAHAQNTGMENARKNGADFILLSDQDTLYPENYVQNMIHCIDDPKTTAAVAPLFRDTQTGSEKGVFYRSDRMTFQKFVPQKGIYEVAQAIASGMILNVPSLEKIGMMDESLFIDWVDFEWCWRARAHGYTILGNADVTITHRLGDSAKNIAFRQVNLRSPIRHYYITRNAFHLALRCPALSRMHRCVLFLKSLRYLVAYPILSKPHLTHLFYVLLGFWHAVTKRLGKLQRC